MSQSSIAFVNVGDIYHLCADFYDLTAMKHHLQFTLLELACEITPCLAEACVHVIVVLTSVVMCDVGSLPLTNKFYNRNHSFADLNVIYVFNLVSQHEAVFDSYLECVLCASDSTWNLNMSPFEATELNPARSGWYVDDAVQDPSQELTHPQLLRPHAKLARPQPFAEPDEDPPMPVLVPLPAQVPLPEKQDLSIMYVTPLRLVRLFLAACVACYAIVAVL